MSDSTLPDRSRRDERAEMYRGALLESEEHFRHLVSAVQDYAIFLLDPEGYVASWNAGAQRIKQYEADEILGRSFSVFYPPEALAKGLPQHELEVAAAEGQYLDEGWRIRKDGSRFWASVSITALRASDGRLRAFLKIVRDLTERKQADEGLRESEERFRLLIQDVEDYAIFMLDPEGFVQSWNFGAERIKGYTEAEILGKHFSCFYPPEAMAQGKPGWLLQKALEYGRIEDEGWRVRKDGERFWANVVLTALYDRQGNLRGFAKVTRDLTERRKIEALEEADRQKNEFLAVLAHELRNPLTPIRSALHILNQPGVTPKAAAQARAIADRQVTHMARLLEDLLDVSRVSEGRIDLRKKIIDLRPTVRAAIESVESLIVGRRQRLTVEMPPDPLWVDVDPIRFEQVLTNLLHNASKYTDPEGEIGVTVEADGPAAVVRVRDSGIGIDPVMLPRIFDLFVQAERRLDRALGGVGVGLTIVKKLVDLHGGSVHAFSAGKGRGTEFVVRVPRSKTAPTEPERPEPAYPPRSSGLRVLVVDDNADAADGLGMLLEMQGHQVEVAYGGEAALASAQTFQPHAVLLDIGMPEIDGYEVARRLRRSPATKSAMLVAITGWGQDEDLRKSREAGFDHHLVKPVEPGAVEHLLAQHQSS